MNRRRLVNVLLLGGALLASGYASAQAWRTLDLLRRSSVADPMPPPRQENREKGAVTQTGIEAALNLAAREAGLRRLTRLSTAGGRRGHEIDVEWESDFTTSLAFLRRMRIRGFAAAVPRLSLDLLDQESGVLRGRATLRPGASGEAAALSASLRNVFAPPWPEKSPPAREAAVSARRMDEERQHERERTEAQRAEREVREQNDARRRAFETRHALTGLVADAKGPAAFLTGENQRSYLLRIGDRIGDARVTSIDEKAGEVRLDADGGLSVILRLP